MQDSQNNRDSARFSSVNEAEEDKDSQFEFCEKYTTQKISQMSSVLTERMEQQIPTEQIISDRRLNLVFNSQCGSKVQTYEVKEEEDEVVQ